jgi:ABC-type branched-subunit amino acid transport system substrate-binding protein
MNTVLGKNKNVSVHAMVASADNVASNAAAQIDNHFKMTQIAYGSTGSYLSYVGPYPYYIRTCPNDAFQGKILANLAFNEFNWLSVTTFNTLDINGYGTDGVQQFILEATKLGITTLSSHQFRPGEKLDRVITEAKKFGARIFLIFMDTKETAR